jgi:hypothetical protein
MRGDSASTMVRRAGRPKTGVNFGDLGAKNGKNGLNGKVGQVSASGGQNGVKSRKNGKMAGYGRKTG